MTLRKGAGEGAVEGALILPLQQWSYVVQRNPLMRVSSKAKFVGFPELRSHRTSEPTDYQSSVFGPVT